MANYGKPPGGGDKPEYGKPGGGDKPEYGKGTYGKPGEIHPLYGVWVNNVIKKLRAEIEEAEKEAQAGLKSGHLNPHDKAEVEKALKALEQAERALGVPT